MDDLGFYRIRDVLKMFPVSKFVWYAGIRKGDYPKPVKLGARCVGWRKSDIHALIEKHSKGEAEYAN